VKNNLNIITNLLLKTIQSNFFKRFSTSVGRSLFCDNNNLTSLEGAPMSVGGDFYCRGNNIPEEEIERYYRTGAVRGTIYSDHGKYKR